MLVAVSSSHTTHSSSFSRYFPFGSAASWVAFIGVIGFDARARFLPLWPPSPLNRFLISFVFVCTEVRRGRGGRGEGGGGGRQRNLCIPERVLRKKTQRPFSIATTRVLRDFYIKNDNQHMCHLTYQKQRQSLHTGPIHLPSHRPKATPISTCRTNTSAISRTKNNANLYTYRTKTTARRQQAFLEQSASHTNLELVMSLMQLLLKP